MSNSGIRKLRTAMALSVGTMMALTVAATPARADHPLVAAAGITGVAAVTAAAVAAGGTIIAASILAAGGVASSLIDAVDGAISRGETGGGNTDGGGESERTEGSNRVHIGQASVPKEFREILKREADLFIRNGTTTKGDGRVMARIDYSVDGDVKRADETVERIALNDEGTLRFTISNIEDAANAPLTVQIDELTLSTEDVPKTHGAVKVTLAALQDGVAIWDWTLQAEQGVMPVLDVPDAVAKSVTDSQPGQLTISDLNLAVPYVAPGAGKTTVVDLVLSVDGFGERI